MVFQYLESALHTLVVAASDKSRTRFQVVRSNLGYNGMHIIGEPAYNCTVRGHARYSNDARKLPTERVWVSLSLFISYKRIIVKFSSFRTIILWIWITCLRKVFCYYRGQVHRHTGGCTQAAGAPPPPPTDFSRGHIRAKTSNVQAKPLEYSGKLNEFSGQNAWFFSFQTLSSCIALCFVLSLCI